MGLNPNHPATKALKLFAAQFRMYERSHRGKGTPDGDDKAQVNEDMAKRAERLIEEDIAGDYSIGSNIWPGLAKVNEESGELQQVLNKIIGVNGARVYPDGTDLLVKTEQEVADLYAALDFFCEANPKLSYFVVEERRKDKLAKFRGWHKHHQAAGL